MKTRTRRILVPATLALCLVSLAATAQEVVKADNNDSLVNGSSWVGGSAPGTADIAVFDSTYAQTGTIGTGAPLSWGGIKVTTFASGANPININNTTTANHVGIGAHGIDISAAERNLRIFSVQVQAGQTWNIAGGRTLEIGVDWNDPLPADHEVALAGSGMLRLIGGTLSLDTDAASSIGSIESYAGTINVAHDLTVAGKFAIGETGASIFNHSAGTVNANSTTGGFGAGLNIGHRIGGNGTYNLSGGTLNSVAAVTVGSGGGNIGILNISAGTANLAGLTLKTSDTASATVNLTGGRLNLGSGGITSLANATNRNLNFGGGTLGATADWSSSLAIILTGTEGDLTIDTLDAADGETARTITLSGIASGTGGLIKTGTGSLVLDAANTYTGDTVVNDGALELDFNGQLRFIPTTNGTTNKVTGSGTAQFDGIFLVDLTNASAANGNEWQLAAVDSQSFGDFFLVTSNLGDFTFADGVHTLVDEDTTWTFTEATGTLAVTSPVSGYATWAAANGLDGTPGKEAGFDDDPDGDGVANGLEWILGGNPLDGQSGGLVTTTATAAGGLTFSFTREPDSIGQATLKVEYNTDLGPVWQSATIGAAGSSEANGVEITIDTNANPHAVTVNIPVDPNAPTGKLFARLSAQKTIIEN